VEAIHQAVDLKAGDIVDFGPDSADYSFVSMSDSVLAARDIGTYDCPGFRLRIG
jgi:hypothetical protein